MTVIPKTVYPTIPKRIPHTLGFSRYCLYFNGANRVETVDDPLDMGTGDFSLGAWFKTTQTGVYAWIIDKRVTGATQPGYRLGILSSDQMRAEMNDGTGTIGITSPLTYNDGRWHHAFATFDRDDDLVFYIDGKEIDRIDISGYVGSVDSAVDLTIGAHDGGGNEWTGFIDEVIVYNRILTKEEVYRLFLDYHNPPLDGLVLWLRFEEGAGLMAYDQSGNGNHGNLLPATDPPSWTRVKKWELRAEVGL